MVNLRWAREAGFATGFLFAIAIAALRGFHIQLGAVLVAALVVVWFCLFALFYGIAKRRHT